MTSTFFYILNISGQSKLCRKMSKSVEVMSKNVEGSRRHVEKCLIHFIGALWGPPQEVTPTFWHPLHFSTVQVVLKNVEVLRSNVKVRRSHVEKCRKSCDRLTERPILFKDASRTKNHIHLIHALGWQYNFFCQECFKVSTGFMLNWNLNLNWT